MPTRNRMSTAKEAAAANDIGRSSSLRRATVAARRRAHRKRRSSLDVPALKTEFLNEILANQKGVVVAVPAAQKKHLLHVKRE